MSACLLIIGAKSDIAQACARVYASKGYSLCLAARRAHELEAFANDIATKNKVQVECRELDILQFASHASFYESLQEKPLGVLCAVGYLGEQSKAENDFSESATIIHSNYTGPVSLLNIIAKDFEKRKEGFLIGISSVAGERVRNDMCIYGSAKAAFSAYLSGLRNRLHKSNVHVLTVKPGPVATKMIAGYTHPGVIAKIFVAQTKEVALDIYKAHKKTKNVLYTKGLWKWVMLAIKVMPEAVFKRIQLLSLKKR